MHIVAANTDHFSNPKKYYGIQLQDLFHIEELFSLHYFEYMSTFSFPENPMISGSLYALIKEKWRLVQVLLPILSDAEKSLFTTRVNFTGSRQTERSHRI